MDSRVMVFGGIEGGATKTVLTIIDQSGHVLAQGKTGPSNPWGICENGQDAFKTVANKLNDLIVETLRSIQVECNHTHLERVAFCLSGAGTKKAQDRLKQAFQSLKINYEIFISSDCLASLFTAFQNGGMVLIAGTGSYCALLNSIDSDFSNTTSVELIGSGGWGNLLGDQGSAFWIAVKAIKYFIKVNDGLRVLETDKQKIEFDELRRLIFDYFKIKNFRELVAHFYEHRKNDFIAGLAEHLSKLALEQNGSFLLELFRSAGAKLADHVIALFPKLTNSHHHLSIVCTGSVFKSWKLIRPGFVGAIETSSEYLRAKCITGLVLLRLAGDDASIGAAFLAARLSSVSTTAADFDHDKYISKLDIILID